MTAPRDMTTVELLAEVRRLAPVLDVEDMRNIPTRLMLAALAPELARRLEAAEPVVAAARALSGYSADEGTCAVCDYAVSAVAADDNGLWCDDCSGRDLRKAVKAYDALTGAGTKDGVR